MYNYRIEMNNGEVINITTDEMMTEDHSGFLEYDDGQFINLDHANHIEINRVINWEEN